MFCVKCGNQLNENDRFCGICGNVVSQEPKVVYVEEKPLESLLDNRTVVALTFLFLLLAFATIIGASYMTRDIPDLNSLYSIFNIISF